MGHVPVGWRRWVPLTEALSSYRVAILRKDLMAGVVLATVLIPAGMGYSQASGLPVIYGLYATLGALGAYAIFGPSRILIVGPDSSLVPIVAATVIPLAAAPEQRVVLAAALAVFAGLICMAAGAFRLGFLTDLLSMPIRTGYLNGIALTLFVGQLPKLFGFKATGDNLLAQGAGFLRGIAGGEGNYKAFALGLGALILILVTTRLRPAFPALLLAVLATILAVPLLGLADGSIPLLGILPQGLPHLEVPLAAAAHVPTLLGAALAISLITIADTSVLSRVLATRDRRRVDPNQELFALGISNAASGLFMGMPVSASNTRTPVAQAAGAQTCLTGLVGAGVVAALLTLGPGLLRNLPSATLAAVVMAAAFRLTDLEGFAGLATRHRGELLISIATTAGVAIFGAIQGIGVAVVLAVVSFLWQMWRPHSAELVDLESDEGFHDIERHPEGLRIPGLILFRFDAPLFFANADLFRKRILELADRGEQASRCVLITAEPITQIDSTAEAMLSDLNTELELRGIDLRFAELRGRLREQMEPTGFIDEVGRNHFYRTVQMGVDVFRREEATASKSSR